MLTEPAIMNKPEQPYAAIRLALSQSEIAAVAPPLHDDVMGWIAAQAGQVAGPPFFDYVAFDADGRMEMLVGVPTGNQLAGDARFTTGVLPGGRYLSVTATVPYGELHGVNAMLLDWAAARGLALDGHVDGARFVDATRLEIYHKDPGEDPSGHPVTEVAFRLAP